MRKQLTKENRERAYMILMELPEPSEEAKAKFGQYEKLANIVTHILDQDVNHAEMVLAIAIAKFTESHNFNAVDLAQDITNDLILASYEEE